MYLRSISNTSRAISIENDLSYLNMDKSVLQYAEEKKLQVLKLFPV